MIRAIVFDLDGVLVDATEWHYEALNKALALFGYTINRDMHLGEYNGLPTRKKLEMLSVQKGYPRELHEFTNSLKQNYTKDVILTKCKPFFDKQLMLSKLKSDGYKLAVCSNSIRESIEIMLKKSGIIEYFDFFIGNDEGFGSKPAPDIYLKSFELLNIPKSEIVIIEDSPHGIAAAKASGAHTCEVSGFNEVNYEKIKSFINEVNSK